MTRSTIFRIALANSMLASGSFAAYRWLLPRKFKRNYDPRTYRLFRIPLELMKRSAILHHKFSEFK